VGAYSGCSYFVHSGYFIAPPVFLPFFPCFAAYLRYLGVGLAHTFRVYWLVLVGLYLLGFSLCRSASLLKGFFGGYRLPVCCKYGH
jgi:hypothetical protein